MLDAQARILFARGETEKAIALQTQAVEKAKNTLDKLTGALSIYYGYPVNGQILRKLEKIIIPEDAEIRDCPLDEAVECLRVMSQRHDLTEPDPTKRGVHFAVRSLPLPRPDAVNGKPAATDVVPAPRIKVLQLKNVPLCVLLKQICEAVHYKYSVEDGVIVLVPSC